jgi:ElaB/YqjD/DUF883 family membrane-anchored ribosome-binding protein
MKFGSSTPSVESAQDVIAKRGKQLVNGIEEGAEAAQDAAHRALEHVSDKIDELQEEAGPAVQRVAERGAALARDGLNTSRELGKRAKRAASQYANACESYVTEQPLKSIAIAAAAGATVAALLMLARNRSGSAARARVSFGSR